MNSKSVMIESIFHIVTILLILCGWFTLNKQIFSVFEGSNRQMESRSEVKRILTLFSATFTFDVREKKGLRADTVDMSHWKSIFMWFFIATFDF